MDKDLREIMELASKRGSRYLKGDIGMEELPGKVAEMGVLLLLSSKRLAQKKSEGMKNELIALQNAVDDLRKVLFNKKTTGS
jgi:hypothetical protein